MGVGPASLRATHLSDALQALAGWIPMQTRACVNIVKQAKWSRVWQCARERRISFLLAPGRYTQKLLLSRQNTPRV